MFISSRVASGMSSIQALPLSLSLAPNQNENHEINNGLLLTNKHSRSFSRKHNAHKEEIPTFIVFELERVCAHPPARSVAYSFDQLIFLDTKRFSLCSSRNRLKNNEIKNKLKKKKKNLQRKKEK